MNLRGLDLNLLVALDVLLEELNVSRASERLHISQPGMSAALFRLREYFSDPLLEVVGRRMMPTPLALTLAGPVRDLMLQAHSLIEAVPDFDPAAVSRTFAFTASDYVATVYLPRVLARVAREAPNVVIEIVSHDDAPVKALERGDIDIIISLEQFLTDQHPSVPLFSERYVCVSWQGNERVREHLDLETYMDLGHVLARVGRVRGAAFDEWFFERFDHPRRIEAVVSAYNLLPLYVVGTQRLATMHERLARHFAASFPIGVHDLPFAMPAIVEAAQWNRFRDRDPGLGWLRNMLIEEAAKF